MSMRQSERVNVVVAIVGLAIVLAVTPLSTLMTVAVVGTMAGVALTYRLTSNPVHIVHADPDDHLQDHPASPR